MTKIDELERKINDLESRVLKLEGNPDIKNTPKNSIDDLGLKLRGKIDILGHQNLVLLALYFKPKQAKSDLLDILLSWGVKKTIHTWLRGGNLNNRLLNTGVIRKDGINSNNEDLFSLTITKGIPKVEKLIQKYDLS